MAVAKVFFDQDMRLGIPGLNQLLVTNKIKPSKGDMMMFINKRRTKLKILWDGMYLLQLSKAEGILSIDDIKAIPNYFKSRFMAYNIERQILDKLNKNLKLERAA